MSSLKINARAEVASVVLLKRHPVFLQAMSNARLLRRVIRPNSSSRTEVVVATAHPLVMPLASPVTPARLRAQAMALERNAYGPFLLRSIVVLVAAVMVTEIAAMATEIAAMARRRTNFANKQSTKL